MNIGVYKTLLEKGYISEKYFLDRGYTTGIINDQNDMDIVEYKAVLLDGDGDVGYFTARVLLELGLNTNTCAWVVSQNNDFSQKNLYLNLGAMGCFSGDVSFDEIVSTVNNVLKKMNSIKSYDRHPGDSDIIFNKEEFELKVRDQRIQLTKLECKLVSCLFNEFSKTVSSEKLAVELWGEVKKDSSIRVANVVHMLRNKIAQRNVVEGQLIKTTRSKGYKLSDNVVWKEQ